MATSGVVRTHVILPRDVLEEVDRMVGQRKRSEFITEVLREKLLLARQAKALQASAGVLDMSKYPEWSSPEAVSAWVRKLRREPGDVAGRKSNERSVE